MSKSKREDVLSDLASRLLSAMLDDIVMDITLQAHQEMARNRAVCDVCHTRCGLVHVPGPSAPQASVQLEGEPISSSNGGVQSGPTNGGAKSDGNVYFECLNCNRQIASNRYAPHLSSCMGIGARKGAARGGNGKSKDNGRSTSPSFLSESGDISDDSKPLKNKAKSKAKQADDAEFNLNKKRPASPATSPAKKKKTTNGSSPLVQARTEPDLMNGASSSFKVPPSKLRESSTFSTLDRSTIRSRSSSIDSHSSASTRTSSVISGRSAPFPLASSLKASGSRATFQRPRSPPRMPPPARVPEPDFMIDVEGDETGSSTDTDDSS
ncbi:hypothetical protein NEOLEDRAFT_1142133 [Neolentinus lepideus HHB14362 ss-1]|uniref:SAGA-associated factor 11 n=1 Tax=Neolentinus lepideus HHB14362 ss-1 TaxID=1314782 RepID=A0A165N9U6_9AGAM|nr:hypothetical protein NEOLEDRAFT_1142133 [Neolentinus lepideus HHB14362 ss-1]